MDDFEGLGDVWDSLLSRSFDNDVFSTWEWLHCWWRHFGRGRDLRILVARDGGEIVGIAPLMLSKYNFLNFMGFKRMEFVGSPHSDYNNFILLKRGRECVDLFLDYLLEEYDDWDCLELVDVREDSMTALSLEGIFNKGSLGLERSVATFCPYIKLPGSVDVFLRGLSRNMQRNLRKRMRRLKRDFRVEFRTHEDFSSVKEAMGIFFKLHQKRWRSRGRSGAFVDEEFRAFHMDVATLFAERGWLSMFFLMADGEPVASIYSFDYGGKKYGYLTGFDPDFYPYSVGNLLKMYAVERCIQKGLREYDLMRGFERYKADWSTGLRRNFRVRLLRRGLFARLYNWATSNSLSCSLIEKLGVSLSCVG